MKNNEIRIVTKDVDISISAKKQMDEIEMTVVAIEALINGLDVNKFDEITLDGRDRFDATMERLLSKIHEQCKWAGWRE